jgi:hypothetical protein
MVASVLFIGLIGIATAGAWFYVSYLRMRLMDLRNFESFSQQFHASAQPLLDDNDTPDEVLDILLFSSRCMSGAAHAKSLYRFLREGARPAMSAESRRRIQVKNDFLARRPELMPPFNTAIFSWFMAMSFTSRFYGPMLRLWLSAIDTSERQEAIAVEFEQVEGVDGCALQAA